MTDDRNPDDDPEYDEPALLEDERAAARLLALFSDCVAKLVAIRSREGTLTELIEGFANGDVILQFSVAGLDVMQATTEPPVNRN